MLVEKEQVALLAAEAVAFLDRIAERVPRGPVRGARRRSCRGKLREPTVPLFRARLIGLGFDPERELVLHRAARALRPTTTRTTRRSPDDGRATRSGYVARIYATAVAGARDGGARRGGGRRRAGRLPAVRHADGSRRAPLPALELDRADGSPSVARAAAELEVLGRMPLVVERHVARRRARRRRARCRRSTSRGGASARCGTSPTGRSASREVAAYEVSEALGWGLVPDTVLRDGPLGIGHGAALRRPRPRGALLHAARRTTPTCSGGSRCSTSLVNNTDRKGGHCLHDDGRRRDLGIDHGLTFHPPWKLRTVIWDFAGEPVPAALLDDVCRVVGGLDGRAIGERWPALLSPLELEALAACAPTSCCASGQFPEPDPGYHSVPWPLV